MNQVSRYVVRERVTGRFDVTVHCEGTYRVGTACEGDVTREAALVSLDKAVKAYGWNSAEVWFRDVAGNWSKVS